MTKNQQQQNLNKNRKGLPSWKLALFFSYCGAGMVGLGMFTYKSIQLRSQMANDTHYARGQIFQSPAFKRMLLTGVGMTFGFIVGMAYLIKTIKPADLFLQQATQINKMYSDSIRIDPIYQDYHIFQTMQYFKVSSQLIEKTQEQFRKIEAELKAQGKQLKPQQTSFQKQLIKLALKRQQAFRSLN